MGSNVPSVFGWSVDWPVPKRDNSAERAISDVRDYAIGRWVDTQKAEADTRAVEECVMAALESEMRMYLEAIGKAGGSLVLQELVARRIEQMSSLNSRSINGHLR